jgi:tRNA (mo5U34)-methyltransferase
MIDYRPFLTHLELCATDTPAVAGWVEQLPAQIDKGLDESRYGDLARWKAVLEQLPSWHPESSNLNDSAITITGSQRRSAEEIIAFTELLKGLHPWRKGPFKFFDVNIDTEWRSDWKWDRLKDQITPLHHKKVLDVGCGSGYHCWRMRGAGADLVIGIDPTPLFVTQFFAAQHYIQDHHVTVLPLGIEDLPTKLRFFDTVFSMGILYHRRSPFDHLIELRDALCSGGELVLETLVIDGEEGEVLVPEGRYARMGNVWFLPSIKTLNLWLRKIGFKDVQLVDVTTTTVDEQRSTEWMSYYSLKQFLDPTDSSKTIEGYPAPKRAVITAKAP